MSEALQGSSVENASNPPAPQDVVQQQGQLAQPAQQSSSVSAAGENLQCQWQGCGERCPTPEALYVSILMHNDPEPV